MPKSAAAKLAAKAKKKIKKAEKKIVKATVSKALQPTSSVPTNLGGTGAYKVRKMKGKGGFFSDLGSMLARPFTEGGKFSLNKTLDSIGSAASLASKLAPVLTGFGDYQVNSNTLMNKYMSPAGGVGTNSVPVFGSIAKGADIVFAHREFVMDITSSTNFNVTTFPLNPGNPILFPWMWQVASLYEECEFLGVCLEYKTTSATAVGSTSTGLGTVIMATDYDCEDTAFTSKRQMEAAEFSNSGVPCETFMHPIECDSKRNVLRSMYVVPGMTASSAAPGDPRFSVLGNFSIATEGQQTAGNKIGELWVSYHIRLSRPILENSGANASYTQHLTGLLQSSTGYVPAITQNKYVVPGFTISTLAVTQATNIVIFTATSLTVGGTYVFSVLQPSTSSSLTAPANSFLVGGTASVLNYSVQPTSPYTPDYNPSLMGSLTASIPSTPVAYGYLGVCVAKFNTIGDSLSVSLATITGGSIAFDIFVTSWNLDVLGSRRKLPAEDVQTQLNRLTLRLNAISNTKDGSGSSCEAASSCCAITPGSAIFEKCNIPLPVKYASILDESCGEPACTDHGCGAIKRPGRLGTWFCEQHSGIKSGAYLAKIADKWIIC